MSESERAIDLSGRADRGRWDAFVHSSPCGHLMQSCEWGDYKEALGWQVFRLGVERDGQIVAGAQMMLRRLPWLPLTVAYVPKGPLLDLEDDRSAAVLLSALHSAARRHRAILLKVEPNLVDSAAGHDLYRRHGFQPSPLTNQPRSTILVDLSGGEEAVLSSMHRRTRRLVRRAAREDLEVVRGGPEDIGAFHRVLQETAEAKHIPLHEQAFYDEAWAAFAGAGTVCLLLARYQGRVVAAKMVFTFGKKSMHLWGGTTPEGRTIYASYLLQWEAQRWAISRGCTCCDLWGIPDRVGEMHQRGEEIPSHRTDGMWGVYLFKRGFGGRIEYYVGAYDYAYRPAVNVATRLLARRSSIDALSQLAEQIEAKVRQGRPRSGADT